VSLVDVLEVIGRVVLVYVVLLAALRLSGRREMAQLTPMDLLTMLLVARAVGDSMVGDHKGLPGGLLAGTTLLALAWLTGRIVFRSRRAERVINGHASVLIDRGHVHAHVLRDSQITDQDLRIALHKHGVTRVEDVARAWLEPDGEITMVTFTDLADAAEHRPRHEVRSVGR
jgi:uncharacterized membrane protein YcaP (DUF421 family)